MPVTTILTGETLTKSAVSSPPDLGILGLGGDYVITLGMYNVAVSLGGAAPTANLLANTILTGRLLTKPE